MHDDQRRAFSLTRAPVEVWDSAIVDTNQAGYQEIFGQQVSRASNLQFHSPDGYAEYLQPRGEIAHQSGESRRDNLMLPIIIALIS
jgi:hypothetical protein